MICNIQLRNGRYWTSRSPNLLSLISVQEQTKPVLGSQERQSSSWEAIPVRKWQIHLRSGTNFALYLTNNVLILCSFQNLLEIGSTNGTAREWSVDRWYRITALSKRCQMEFVRREILSQYTVAPSSAADRLRE